MTADDARKLLLVRAFEHPLTAPWTAADAAWATAEAARAEGGSAPAERLAARRTAFAFERLVQREPAVASALAADRHAAWLWALVPLAFAAGLALDSIGPSGRLNIVALPLLGVMAWNLAVYGLLALWMLSGRSPATGLLPLARALLPDGVARSARRLGGESNTAAALRRYAAAWAEAGRPLHAARLAGVLHAAAAALAAGLLASLYLRGLAFEYRAGWDSTFLDAGDVRRLLALTLAPALALTDGVLPSAERLEALRFANGPGVNAASWIHGVALSVLLVVLLPRNLLLLWSAWRAKRLERALPLAPELLQIPGLHPARPEATLTVQLVPCNYHLDDTARAALPAVLEARLDARVRLQLVESLPLDLDEAGLAARLPAPEPGAALLPLLALTATPERETHGAFLAALAPHRRGPWPRLVLIDELGFRRFDERRRAERRAAWQAMLADLGLEAVFIDLGAT